VGLSLGFCVFFSPEEITTGLLGGQVVLDGSLMLPWRADVGGLKSEPDLVFSYGTSTGTFQGKVIYAVPEPGTMALLTTGAAVLLLERRRRTAQANRGANTLFNLRIT
jgi:hypothetical protein